MWLQPDSRATTKNSGGPCLLWNKPQVVFSFTKRRQQTFVQFSLKFQNQLNENNTQNFVYAISCKTVCEADGSVESGSAISYQLKLVDFWFCISTLGHRLGSKGFEEAWNTIKTQKSQNDFTFLSAFIQSVKFFKPKWKQHFVSSVSKNCVNLLVCI